MSHFNSGIEIVPRQNGSLPNLLSYGNGNLNQYDSDDEYHSFGKGNGIISNGFMQPNLEKISVFPITLELSENEKRFGFSVVGGVDEGFRPRIDEVVQDLPADRKGVRVGDEIEKVNDKSIRYSTHAQIVTTIHESVRKGQIILTLRRSNHKTDETDGGNNNMPEVQSNLPEQTRAKLEDIIRNPRRPSNKGVTSSQENLISDSSNKKGESLGSYTSGSTLSLSHGNGIHSPIKTVDPPFIGMDNYGYDWRHSHYNSAVPDYNQEIHGPPRTSYLSSIGSEESRVPMMDSEDCQAVIAALMRYASNETDQHLMKDLNTLQSTIETRHMANALKVQSKIVELENQGRGPHFVSAIHENAVELAMQITNFIRGQRTVSKDALDLMTILVSTNMKEFLLAHDRSAKIDNPYFGEDDVVKSESFERNDSARISTDRISTDRLSNDLMSVDDDDQIKIVKIDKGEEPLGATVRNEGTAVVIGRIVNGGAAQKSGLLHEGDEIVEINGVNMRGKSVEEVCELLADMNGMLTFLIKPSNKSQQNLFASAEFHVRALFDYDPNDDDFIPCRELGLAFSKRDILHIVNQDDPNWWQAWREGTSGNELAGLIPAKNFQKQREEMKIDDKKKEKTTTCGCFSKNKAKQALKIVDDEENVLTYQEVGLYHPEQNRKRPIVLIGPTKIGRRELRQRLLQVAPERFGSAVPHTSRRQKPDEINGKEYYFITKNHFKEHVASGKFVEHGEYDGHYYGTSLDSIREVVESGKVCVVNLHCQALKILRDSLLKPFVVFISPPTIEKIKRLRRGNIDAFNPNAKLSGDEELEEMIFSAQEMEDTYGHYFDKIIVNTDLERTFDELIKAINELEAKNQWISKKWLRPT